MNYDESLKCYYLAYTSQPVFRQIFKNHKKVFIVHRIEFSQKLYLYIFSIHFTICNIHAMNIQFKIIYLISYGLDDIFKYQPILYQKMNSIYLSIPKIIKTQSRCLIFIANVNVLKSCCYV